MLHQGTDEVARNWQIRTDIPTPFWAFPWPGGQAMARYLLDHPERVRGKRVLDFASGSGVIAIAAAKAGAAKVWAYDIDPLAGAATQLNAASNGVAVENIKSLPMERPFKKADIILMGDACYNQAVAARILRWLYLCVGGGVPVLLADPGRAFTPKTGRREVARYEIRVRPQLEDTDMRTTLVFELSLPDDN